MGVGLVAILVGSLCGQAAAAEPTGELVLDAGAWLTASATVQAAVSTSDGSTPTEVRLANAATTVDGILVDGETHPWATAIAWSLDAAPCPCGDGERTVWAQWRMADGPWSSIVSDTITVDRTGPVGTVVIDGDAPTMGDPWGWRGPGYTFPSVRLTMTVVDAGPNLPPRAWAVSRDGTTWEQHPLDAYGTFEHEYELIGMNVDEGTKTVWVRWQDGAGNWSEPATDTITLRYQQVGRVIVGDGGGYMDRFVVPVRVPVDAVPPEGVASVWLASDYWGCDNQPYDRDCMARRYAWTPGMVISWDMRDPSYLGSTREGHRRVVAWFVSKTGRVSRLAQQGFIIDREEPVAGPPRPLIAVNSVVGETSSSRVTASIRWSSGGTGSPIASNRLQQSTNSGSWTTVTLPVPTATTATRSLSPAASYRFRARSVDRAGNSSSWATGAAFRVAAKQQQSPAVRYGGTWTTKLRADASGGSLAIARAKGARATLTFTGRGIAVVAPRSLTGGEMNVYVDGAFIKSVHLWGTSYQPRRVVFSKSWTSSGTHTVSIVKKWANTDYPISLDAFVVLR